VHVLQQAVLDQLGDLRQAHQVRRVVGEDTWSVLGDDRELVLADVPFYVRVLLGELVGQIFRQREARFEVPAQGDRRGAACGRGGRGGAVVRRSRGRVAAWRAARSGGQQPGKR